MSKLPSMPLYVDAFEADTAHLTLEEDGAYNRLLRLCWRSPECSVPDEREWIQRRLRVDAETYDRVVAPLLAEFFTRDQGRIWQKRQRQEYGYVTTVVERRREAGRKGGKAKALKRSDIDPSTARRLLEANDKQTDGKPLAPTPTPTPTPTLEKEAPSGASKKRAARLSPDWRLPKDWGDWASEQGLDEVGIRREADRFRDYWIAKAGKDGAKLDWMAVWRNWIRKAIEDRPAPRSRGGSGRAPEIGEEREIRGERQSYQGAVGGWVRVYE